MFCGSWISIYIKSPILNPKIIHGDGGEVQLKSSDDMMFEVDESVAFVFGKISQMIPDAGVESVILCYCA